MLIKRGPGSTAHQQPEYAERALSQQPGPDRLPSSVPRAVDVDLYYLNIRCAVR